MSLEWLTSTFNTLSTTPAAGPTTTYTTIAFEFDIQQGSWQPILLEYPVPVFHNISTAVVKKRKSQAG